MSDVPTPFFSPLPYLGILTVSGVEAEKFLQGQLTCDVLQVTSKELVLGAHCNPQGRVISLFYLWREKDTFFLVMPKNLIPIAGAALKKYAQFFRTVTLSEINSLHCVGIFNTLVNLAITLPNSHRSFIFSNAISEINFPEENENKWKQIEIAEGFPTIFPETSGMFLPHEINLHLLKGVSFNKGCYTGQEIIARMHYKGKLKNHMYRVTTQSEEKPKIGQDIYPKGNIVDWVEVGYNKYELLVVASEQDIDELFLDSEKKYSLTLATLPYSLKQ